MKTRYELARDGGGYRYMLLSKTLEPGHEGREEDIPWVIEATDLPHEIARATLKGLRDER